MPSLRRLITSRSIWICATFVRYSLICLSFVPAPTYTLFYTLTLLPRCASPCFKYNTTDLLFHLKINHLQLNPCIVPVPAVQPPRRKELCTVMITSTSPNPPCARKNRRSRFQLNWRLRPRGRAFPPQRVALIQLGWRASIQKNWLQQG